MEIFNLFTGEPDDLSTEKTPDGFPLQRGPDRPQDRCETGWA